MLDACTLLSVSVASILSFVGSIYIERTHYAADRRSPRVIYFGHNSDALFDWRDI